MVWWVIYIHSWWWPISSDCLSWCGKFIWCENKKWFFSEHKINSGIAIRIQTYWLTNMISMCLFSGGGDAKKGAHKIYPDNKGIWRVDNIILSTNPNNLSPDRNLIYKAFYLGTNLYRAIMWLAAIWRLGVKDKRFPIKDILDTLEDIHFLFIHSWDYTCDTGIIISTFIRSETTGVNIL